MKKIINKPENFVKEFIIDSLKLYIKWFCNKKKESEIERDILTLKTMLEQYLDRNLMKTMNDIFAKYDLKLFLERR